MALTQPNLTCFSCLRRTTTDGRHDGNQTFYFLRLRNINFGQKTEEEFFFYEYQIHRISLSEVDVKCLQTNPVARILNKSMTASFDTRNAIRLLGQITMIIRSKHRMILVNIRIE